MTKLPGASYVSDSARTEQHIKDVLEAMRSGIGEVGGGYTASGAVTGSSAIWTVEEILIDNGALASVPQSNVVLIRSQSAAATDGLQTMPSTGLPDGRILYLKAETEEITVASGSSSKSGEVDLSTPFVGLPGPFVLKAGRTLVVMLRDTGTTPYWQEVSRSYGSDHDDEILFRGGLVDDVVQVATSLNTPGTHVTKGNLLKVNPSVNLTNGQFLTVNATGQIEGTANPSGGDADTLGTVAKTGFIILNPGNPYAEQIIQTPISAKNTVDIDQAVGSEDATLQFTLAGTARGSIKSDGSLGSGSLTMMNLDGSENPKSGIRIDASDTTSPIRYQIDSSGGFQSLTPGPGAGLDADKLDGSHLAEIIEAISWTAASEIGANHFLANERRGYIILGKAPNQIQITWGGELDNYSWQADSPSTGSGTIYRRTFPRAFSEQPLVCGMYSATITSGSRSGESLLLYPRVTNTFYATRPSGDNSEHRGMYETFTLDQNPIPPLIAIGRPAS